MRGCSYLYGFQAAKQFLEENSLLSIVRAHEAQSIPETRKLVPSREIDRRQRRVEAPSARTVSDSPGARARHRLRLRRCFPPMEM